MAVLAGTPLRSQNVRVKVALLHIPGASPLLSPASLLRWTRFALLLALPALACTAIAGDIGYATRDLNLQAEPRQNAAVVGKLAKNGKFERVGSQNFWTQISIGELRGWVPSFYLSWTEAPQTNTGKELVGAAGLATQRRGGEVTAVIGIRGLDEEQLKAARYSEEELKRMESFLAPAPAAAAFAQEGSLSPKKMDYLSGSAPDQSAQPAGAN
jgi:hypothetical protein